MRPGWFSEGRHDDTADATYTADALAGNLIDFIRTPKPRQTFVVAPWLSQGHLPPAAGFTTLPAMNGRAGTIGHPHDIQSIYDNIDPSLTYDELVARAAEQPLALRGPQRVFTPPRRF